MQVKQLMSQAVVLTTPEESIGRALHLLESSGIRHLPVVSGARVVGIVSDRDVREYRLPIIDELDHPQLSAELLARPVADAMNRDFAFVDPHDSVARSIDLMLEHDVGALPVLDRETGELRGMLSYVDVLRYARDAL